MANFSSKSNPDTPQFGSRQPANAPGGSPHCAQCEAMLTDFLDGTLAPEDQARFDAHVAGCAACTQMLADAQRGAAWLELLRSPRPEPPAALLERILAQTSGQGSGQTAQPGTRPTIQAVAATPGTLLTLPAAPIPAGELALPSRPATVLPFRARVAAAALPVRSLGRTLLQPRLAMTAAMAFFSIGLTLNLTGVHLNHLHAADLKPSSVKRSFYQANAHVVRYVDNLRAVYELESRVRDLQRASDTDIPATPESATPESTAPKQTPAAKPGQPQNQNQPQPKQSRPRSNSGTSWRLAPTPHAILTASVDEGTIRVPQVSLLRPGFPQPQSPTTLASLTNQAATPTTVTLSPTTHQQEGATV